MAESLVAVSILAGLGLAFGTILAVAWRYMRVEEDPRIDGVEALLPGTNCGACGEPGCRALAEKLVEGAAQPALCTVSSPEGLEQVAEYLGVDAGDADRSVARLHCGGDRYQALQIATYEGYGSCSSAHLVARGGKGCPWGCLGLGDCEVVCDFDAIEMSSAGLPAVDPVACTACGDCVIACPRDLFELLPARRPLLVQCRIPLSGEAATDLCKVACDACGRCAQDQPAALIMEGGLPVVGYGPTTPDHEPEATFRCPTGAIRWVDGAQFQAPARQLAAGGMR